MRLRLLALLASLILATFATGASAAGIACAQLQNQPASCVSNELPCPDEGVRDDCVAVCAQMCSGLATAVTALPEMPALHGRPEAPVALVLIATLGQPDPPPPRR